MYTVRNSETIAQANLLTGAFSNHVVFYNALRGLINTPTPNLVPHALASYLDNPPNISQGVLNVNCEV